ncbi:MAG: hypothetical protein C4523_06465 [Myxococcales bacterium]|nr:MAG: hypothetical protein C4523_06465 [Myxococcales bacterium]
MSVLKGIAPMFAIRPMTRFAKAGCLSVGIARVIPTARRRLCANKYMSTYTIAFYTATTIRSVKASITDFRSTVTKVDAPIARMALIA